MPEHAPTIPTSDDGTSSNLDVPAIDLPPQVLELGKIRGGTVFVEGYRACVSQGIHDLKQFVMILANHISHLPEAEREGSLDRIVSAVLEDQLRREAGLPLRNYSIGSEGAP